MVSGAGAAEKVAAKEAEHVIAKAVEKAGVREAEQVTEKTAAKEAERTFGKSVEHAVSGDYKKTFFTAHPNLDGRVVVHHGIEQQAARRYPGVVSHDAMHGLDNLRGIPKEVNSDLHLSRIRKEWNRFYKTHPNATFEELSAFRKVIDGKFGSEFLPPH
jgi:hypothetical protein